MSNEQKNPKSPGASLKLSGTQLVLLSAAAQRDDCCLTAAANLKGGAAQKVVAKLIAAGLVQEIKAKAGTPVWRRDEESAQSFALKLTAAGLKAIAVDDRPVEGEAAAADEPSNETQEAVPVGDTGRSPNQTRSKAGEVSDDDSRKPQESGAPSAPRSGSKAAEIIELMQRDQGASLVELIAATDWLPHTTRAALAGLRKRGYEIARSRSDGATRYTIERAARAPNGLSSDSDQSASEALGAEQAA